MQNKITNRKAANLRPFSKSCALVCPAMCAICAALKALESAKESGLDNNVMYMIAEKHVDTSGTVF